MADRQHFRWQRISSSNGNLIPQHPKLKQLQARQFKVEQQTAQLKALLPKDLEPHCIEARVADKVLTIYCNAGCWATRLRFLQKNLLSEMGASTLQIRILPPTTSITRRSKPIRAEVSQASAACLATIAEEFAGSDPELSRALKRIAASRDRTK